jgi:hypothetical protein
MSSRRPDMACQTIIPQERPHMKRRLSALATLAATLLALCGGNADASFTIDAAGGGGAQSGATYANFNDLSLGTAGGTSGGIGVAFSGEGQAVQGSSSDLFAAPYLSGSNNVFFGDPTASGPDSTTYLTTGIGSVSLSFSAPQTYLGLLWGSVDTYNSLQFYNGGTLIGTITGTDVNAAANGDQGVSGTFYVNINSSEAFTQVVATSTNRAFEFDNVAYNSAVPEPASMVMLGMGLVSVAFANRRRLAGKRGSVATR